MQIKLLTKKEITPEKQRQLAQLYSQLSPDKSPLKLHQILSDENNITIGCCEANNKLIGIALMCNYTVLSGKKGWIEDVVVDQHSRGQGIGRKLVDKLLIQANEMGLDQVLLFTADHRKVAINLYESMGFKEKNSRIYQLILKDN